MSTVEAASTGSGAVVAAGSAWARALFGAAEASVRPSERMLSARTVISRARPGKKVAHQPPHEEDLPPVGEDAAPAGVGVLHTRSDEGEAGLEDDGLGDHDGREHHDGRHAVDGDVAEHDVAAAGPDDLLGGDVVLPVLGEDVGAYDAGEGGRVDEGDGEDDHRDAGAEHGDEDGRERDRREGHDDVEGAHDGLVAESARGGGERSEDGAA